MFKLTGKSMVVGLALAGMALAVGSCRRPYGHASPDTVKRYSAWFVDDTLDDLDASDEQRATIHEARLRLVDDYLSMREQRRLAGRALLGEWEQEAPDADRVRSILDGEIERRRETSHRVAREILSIHAILSPEQRAQVAAELRERLASHK